MEWGAVWTLVVIATAVGVIVFSRIGPELVLSGAVVALVASGVLAPAQALAGLANPGVVTVALMYVIVAGIRETGGVEFLITHVLGRPRGLVGAQARLIVPTMAASAFVNNTPIVAAFIPAVLSWCRRLSLSPSQLLLPLSYAAVLGGTCTLIGTSTNLAVDGLWRQRTGGAGMGMFDITWIGLPVALVGLVYMLLFGRRLLPERGESGIDLSDPHEYTVEMRVAAGGPLVGKSIEQAGLRRLQGLFLIEIDRAGRLIPSVGPEERLEAEDQLIFVGITESVVELRRVNGLQPAARSFDPSVPHPERRLIEVAISPRSDLVGKSIREGRFRSIFGAAVIAVSRHGERIHGKIGDIVLQASDTLLLEADADFLERNRHGRDFLLMSELPDSQPPRHDRAWLAWAVLAGVVLTAAFGWLDILEAAMLGAAAMLVTGCCSGSAARRSLDGQVLLAIAAAISLGGALEVSGAARALGGGLLTLAGDQPWLLLALAYISTMLLTEVLTNNATALLMFPIVTNASDAIGADPMPFVITVMMAASASFATPLGYQTNLMVYGPGGYRFVDYLRFGGPLNLLCAAMTIGLAPLVWGF